MNEDNTTRTFTMEMRWDDEAQAWISRRPLTEAEAEAWDRVFAAWKEDARTRKRRIVTLDGKTHAG